MINEKILTYAKENLQTMSNVQIAENLGISIKSLRKVLYANNIKRLELEFWTKEQVDYLKRNYKKIGDSEIAEYFQKKFPKKKIWTKKHIEKKRLYLKLKRTPEELKLIHSRNTKKGRFAICNKKRWLATGVTPIGTIVFWSNQTKKRHFIRTEKGFVCYNRFLWESQNGKIPKGMCVARKNDNETPAQIEELELISRAELGRRNKLENLTLPTELREIIYLTNKIKKMIRNEN